MYTYKLLRDAYVNIDCDEELVGKTVTRPRTSKPLWNEDYEVTTIICHLNSLRRGGRKTLIYNYKSLFWIELKREKTFCPKNWKFFQSINFPINQSIQQVLLNLITPLPEIFTDFQNRYKKRNFTDSKFAGFAILKLWKNATIR